MTQVKLSHKSEHHLYALAFFTALGSTTLGYCYSVYNPTLNHISRAMAWTDDQIAFREGLGFAMIPGGALIVLIINFYRFSKVKRRLMLIIADVFAIVGAALTTVAVFEVFIIGRFLLGVSAGLNGPMMPVYIRENAPPEISGKMGSSLGISSSIGKCIGFILAFGLPIPPKNGNSYWRMMYAVPILFSVMRIIYLVFFNHYDTPKYYALNDRDEDAKEVLKKVYSEDKVEHALEDIKIQKSNEKKIGLSSLWAKYRRQVLTCTMIAFLMQTTGIHTLTAYSTAILTGSLVNDNLNPRQIRRVNYVNLWMGIVRIVSAVFGGFLLDKLGRKALFIIGSIIQTASLIIMAIAIQTNQMVIAEIMVITFSIGVAGGFGLVSFVYYSEVLPATGCSLMLIIDNIMNLILNFSFPLMAAIPGFGFAGALYLMGGISLVGLFGLLKFIIETKGHTMSQIYHIFEKMSKRSDDLIGSRPDEEEEALIKKDNLRAEDETRV